VYLRRSINPTVDADGRLWCGARRDTDANFVGSPTRKPAVTGFETRDNTTDAVDVARQNSTIWRYSW
jgi:hypothetical protein